MKKLNITFCSFPDFSGNAKALYEYMIKRYKDNMNYIWIVNNESTVKVLNEKGIKSILIGTKGIEEYIPKTDVFFTTHANLTGDKQNAKNAIYIELWHGVGPKPVGYLAKNMTKSDRNWYNTLPEEIDYIIVSSSMYKTIYSSMFNINPERILPLGLPLLDEIKYSNGKFNLSKLIKREIKSYNKIIYYMPTFKLGCGRKDYKEFNDENIFNLERYDEKKFLKYLKDNNYLLCIKRHPSDEFIYPKIENDNIINIDNEMLINNKLNVNNILNAADILITDYSSLGTEISFIDKPVIYISTDVDEYMKDRGIIFENYEFWTGGIECKTYDEMIKLIDKYIGKKYVNKFKNLHFSNLKDGGCDSICNYIFDGYGISKNVHRFTSEIRKLEEKIREKDNKILSLNERINYLEGQEQELFRIKNSRSYKVVKRINNLRKKVSNEKD